MYQIENKTEGNVFLMDGAIDLGPTGDDRTMLLPDYARNHPDVRDAEGSLIEVTPLDEEDLDGEDDEVVDLSAEDNEEDSGDEERSDAAGDSDSAVSDEAESSEETEEKETEEKETSEEEEEEKEEEEELPSVDEFKNLNKDPMKELLKKQGWDDIDFRNNKSELVAHYELKLEENGHI